MLDSVFRSIIESPLNRWARPVARLGVTANAITLLGFALIAPILWFIAHGNFTGAIILITLNRILDGLDGAVARAREYGESDFGGFLDIVCDFILYAGVIFAFALFDTRNALAAAFLIFSYMGTASSFLAYAIIAAKRNITSEKRGRKAFTYLGGLAEGSETIIVMLLMCIIPAHFQTIAIIYGVLCWLTVIGRIVQARQDFAHISPNP